MKISPNIETCVEENPKNLERIPTIVEKEEIMLPILLNTVMRRI